MAPQRRRFAVFFVLAVLFLVPAITKATALVDAGNLRWVEALMILVGGFGGGASLTRALTGRRQAAP